MFDLSGRFTDSRLEEFADKMIDLQDRIDFRVSARGWAYILEGERVINKDQFDRIENLINKCRTKGLLPIDFCAEEEARKFHGIEIPESETPVEYLRGYLRAPLNCWNWYTPDWWEGEEIYMQMIVEKVDLLTLFTPVCQKYHIPIANAKGWSSLLQRAEYAKRFLEAEIRGLKCVLLYCGDHDPDGLRISDNIRNNLDQIKNIYWSGGTTGYDPENLEIHRFGLNANFINRNNLTWIDNLITGRKGEIAREVSPGKYIAGRTANGRPHPNFDLPYLQEYLSEHGCRKCEANAIVTIPEQARALVTDAIHEWLGNDALQRFNAKRETIRKKMTTALQSTGLLDALGSAIDELDDYDENSEQGDEYDD